MLRDKFNVTIHPRSLQNLRPPWRKGESGNPAGRRRGSRNRVTWAEKFSRKVLQCVPDLRQHIERAAITDIPAYYQRRLQEYMTDRRTNPYATELAKLDIVALMLERMPRKRRQPGLCAYCGQELWRPVYSRAAEKIVIIHEAAGPVPLHARCIERDAVHRTDEAHRLAEQMLRDPNYPLA
jgi:hypothetical protein